MYIELITLTHTRYIYIHILIHACIYIGKIEVPKELLAVAIL
jgi:hypothetical protein